MTPDPKSPQLPADVKDSPRRKYTAPQLKRLGSVRDLTLGSPAGVMSDGPLGKIPRPM
jgi:hypothetical protein